LHILIQSNAFLQRSYIVGIIQDGKFWFYVSDIAIVISEKKTTPANDISCFLTGINKTSNIQLKTNKNRNATFRQKIAAVTWHPLRK
ncbi:MAG TPA: hypothetical protein VIM79_15805, partial [Niastella sp.]